MDSCSKKKVVGIRSFDVPHDLMFNILRRLPTKSIKRFNCVCKLWHSLLSEKKRLMISRSYGDSKPVIEFVDLDSQSVQQQIDFPVECSYSIQCSDSEVIRCSYLEVVGCCDGLLCTCVYLDKEKALILWNPFSRKYKRATIPKPKHDDDDDDYILGFGCDRSTLDYMIVKFFHKRSRKDDEMLSEKDYSEEDYETFYQIYSLNTDSWEQGKVKLPYWLTGSDSFLGSEIISMNGALYWNTEFVKNWPPCESETECGILRFDLTDHKLSMIDLPAEFSINPNLMFHISDFGGRLCIERYGIEKYGDDDEDDLCDIHIWIMEEETRNWIKVMKIIPAEEEILLKLVSIPVEHYKVTVMHVVCFKNDNEVIVSIEIEYRHGSVVPAIELLLYNSEDNTFKKFDSQVQELGYKDFILYTKTPIYSPLSLQ